MRAGAGDRSNCGIGRVCFNANEKIAHEWPEEKCANKASVKKKVKLMMRLLKVPVKMDTFI